MFVLAQIGDPTQSLSTYSGLDRFEQLAVILIILLVIFLLAIRNRGKPDALAAEAEKTRADALNALIKNQTNLLSQLDGEHRTERKHTEQVIDNNTAALAKVGEMISSLKFSIKGVTDMQEQATENIIQLQASVSKLQALNEELACLVKEAMPVLTAMPFDHEKTYQLMVQLTGKFDEILTELRKGQNASQPSTTVDPAALSADGQPPTPGT